ncbi:MAG: pyridoxal-phosphate dependent enzyme [Halanaeroarchaeum sp.]
MATDLVCADCGRAYEAGPGEPWRCECGHPLDFAERPLPDGPPKRPALDRGLWAFGDFLPVEPRVTLGEGWTPLADAPAWDATFKLEYVFPSGSFKDRGATTTLSRAAELGVERVVEDSSGNAGAAIAQYAARAGIAAEIYVPAGVKETKLRAIERAGATPVRVEGTRQDVTDACVAAVEDGDAWYASHAWNPAFFAGTATVAFEIAAQRDWSVPDALVLPVGHGTLFLGAYRGFAALRDAGWTDRLPRLLGVQATGVAPLVAARGGDPGSTTNDAADGIQISDPVRDDQILAAIQATDGDVVAVDGAATESALDALHRRGFYVEPTSAVAVAGLEAYREAGVLEKGADVLVALTGSGLKS